MEKIFNSYFFFLKVSSPPPSLSPLDLVTNFPRSYAIPGYRLGLLIAPSTLLIQLDKILDCLIINPPRAAQNALAWAFDGTREWRTEKRVELKEKGREFASVMRNVPDWRVEASGGYYAWVRLPLPPKWAELTGQVSHPYKGVRSKTIARLLAQKVDLLVLPGSFFLASSTPEEEDHFLRFCEFLFRPLIRLDQVN